VHGWDAGPDLLGAPLVVSTVPAGGADALAAAVPSSPATLLDVVYAPWPTALAAAWAAAGGTVVGGLDLLVHQAALQVRLMTGCDASVGDLLPVLRRAGTAALGA
jgi:shikimate dehydrogenase